MKKLFMFLALILFLNGCATPSSEHVFIDSNVSADVYTGDKKIGETPFYKILSGNEIEHLSIRKKGYKTVRLKASSVRLNKKYTRGGLSAVSQMTFSSTSGCEKIPLSVLNEEQAKASVRFSFGKNNTEEEILRGVALTIETVRLLRKF